MFVTLRSYTNSKKAVYIKYRLERSGIECKLITENENIRVEVATDQVELAVEELLKVQTEYPAENFQLETDMGDLMNIIIPIDFSEKSFEAGKYAVDIAQHRPVEIKFMHVWNDEIDDFMAVKSSHEIEEFKRLQRNELNREIEKKLNDFRIKFKNHIIENNVGNNLLYHFTIKEGIWGNQLEYEIGKFQPKLVLAGHNDNKKWQFRISRDVVNSVINLGVCPVFYIPQKVYYKPFDELHIMYATNFDCDVMQSYENLKKLSLNYNTHIYCIHVAQEGAEQESEVKMTEVVKNMEAQKSDNLTIHSHIISDNKLLKGFNSYIKDNHIDMLSFTSPEYGMWHKLFNPDNLKSLMKGSSLPMLIFRYK